MSTKDIRRLLADARETKQALMARSLRIDWSKSVFLASEITLEKLGTYFKETNDTFALKIDENQQMYLFDVRIMKDSSKQIEAVPELAIVLDNRKRS